MTAFSREGRRRPPLYLERNLMIVFSVTITAMMGVGSLTPAFPTIMQAFHISSQQVGLLITFFTLPGIVFAPVVGLMADRYGRKRVLVPSLLLFAFAGASCAFVTGFHLLLALRFVQGTGGAALTALNNTLIGDLYSGRTRAQAIGYNASVQNMATLNNPMLGGLVALAGWRYPFFLPLLAVPVACFVAFGLNSPEPSGKQSLREYLGGAIKGIVNRRMLTLCSANLTQVIVAFGALMVYLALLMKQRFDADPFTIGVVIASASFVSTLMSSQAIRLTRVMTYRQMIVLGTLLSAVGMATNSMMPALWLLLVPAFLRGVAQGILNPSLYTLLLENAPVDSRGAVMAFNGMLSRTGQTLGPLVFGLVYALGGMDSVFYASAAFLVASALAVGWALGPTQAGAAA
jgi:MFS family permease